MKKHIFLVGAAIALASPSAVVAHEVEKIESARTNDINALELDRLVRINEKSEECISATNGNRSSRVLKRPVITKR